MTAIDWTLVRRGVRVALRRYRALVLLILVFGSGLIVTSALLSATAGRQAVDLRSEGALRLIQVGGTGASRPIMRSDVADWAQIPGVVSVIPWQQVRADTDLSGLRQGWLTPRVLARGPALAAGAEPVSVADVLVPEYALATTDLPMGVSARVTQAEPQGVQERVVTLRVVGIYLPSPTLPDGDSAIYATPELMARMRMEVGDVDDDQPCDRAYVEVASMSDVSAVQAALLRGGFPSQSVAGVAPVLPLGVELLGWVHRTALLLLVILSLASGLVVGNAMRGSRAAEVGTLRALGWRRTRVLRLFLAELAGFGLAVSVGAITLGTIAGLTVGTFLNGRTLWGSVLPVMLVPEPIWLAVVAATLPLGCCLGALRAVHRLSSLPPDEALRSW